MVNAARGPEAAATARARRAAAAVTDPELPMLTLADLGVLREVAADAEGGVDVALTPTYSGCPAMAAMRADVVRALKAAGFTEVRVRTALHPPWTSDWITERGRRRLAEHGISPPGPAPRHGGPVPLSLVPRRRALRCPRCGARGAELTSEFGATACRALYRCAACGEPFEHVKEI
ncbi:1,2-phenylacetyl-CoA epoxidase subunit PaaD [Streptomonospora nanhaiensis]|uniref:1,2-phenylacetyl-CoA epoxidase subunit PaaD n=1 Tax=Streptomonospora nanhaiensis TaxID=1323731 RepID=UPI0027E1D640|nr:1,2-phenylacetyl-CoA epoxidase subunit PaaD [Streptomonospora nanhaiensis]